MVEPILPQPISYLMSACGFTPIDPEGTACKERGAMPDLEFTYAAQRFKPRRDLEKHLLLFVAPAADIRSWAGVPRKAFDYKHGFQRTLHPGRVGDVARFFREEASNFSPTSIVVGFTGAVEVEAIGNLPLDPDGTGHVRVRIRVPDYPAMALEALVDLALERLRDRLDPAAVAGVEGNVGAAVAEAVRLQDEDVVDDAFGIDAATDQDAGVGIAPSAGDRSFLADFYAQLLGFKRGIIAWPDERELREVLYSMLRPAIIVDGQHRVFGGALAEPDMRFAVCAVPDSSWEESVFQFVVINQKAKPIKPAFLSSIIATSLNASEIQEVYGRLKGSKIDVDRAEIMERVNADPASPFAGMVDFEVANAPGFLQFPGMATLVRAFHNIPNSHAVLLEDGQWDSVEGQWIEHFFAFWRGVRRSFEERDHRLWQEPSPEAPNNLLKIVALQEIQLLMLDTWADARLKKLDTPENTERLAFDFWADFPTTFFTDEWRQKGLQTTAGRQILRDAINQTRRNIGRKNWGHRRLRLFSD